jgi:hypothetical protein
VALTTTHCGHCQHRFVSVLYALISQRYFFSQCRK